MEAYLRGEINDLTRELATVKAELAEVKAERDHYLEQYELAETELEQIYEEEMNW